MNTCYTRRELLAKKARYSWANNLPYHTRDSMEARKKFQNAIRSLKKHIKKCEQCGGR